MAKYIAETICIASIYPGQLPDQRRNYGPTRDSVGNKAMRSTNFHLEPVPRGKKPFILEVSDCFEDVIDLVQQSGNQGGAARPRMPKPVPVETIVSDLIASWTGGMFNVPAGAKPGVIQIAGSVPTQKEMSQMEEQQAAYFEHWFSQGEGLYRGDPATIDSYKTYTAEMRLAAQWLGRMRPWSDAKMATELVPCPFCTKLISDRAIVCPECQRQVAEIPAHLAALQGAAEKPGAHKGV